MRLALRSFLVAGFLWSGSGILGCATIPKPAIPYKPMQEQIVKYVSGDMVLEGTLCTPENADGHKVPAFVIAHGSGPNSRDGFMEGQLNMGFGFTIPVYAELAWALCDAGYTTLRYDKRTCNEKNKCYQNQYTTQPNVNVEIRDFMDDVLAGVDFLSSDEMVDNSLIFVVGHSQSAQFIPHLMKASKDIRAGVMLAAPYRPIDKVLAGQLQSTQELLERLKIKKEFADSATKDLESWVADLKSLREGRFEGNVIGSASTKFWKSWMDTGDQAPTVARTLRKPLLVLSGDYDWNVPTQETRDWEDWLKYNSRTQHHVVVVADVTHALNEVHEREITEVKPHHIERHISPKVVEGILQFTKEVIQIEKEEREAKNARKKKSETQKPLEKVVSPKAPKDPKTPK